MHAQHSRNHILNKNNMAGTGETILHDASLAFVVIFPQRLLLFRFFLIFILLSNDHVHVDCCVCERERARGRDPAPIMRSSEQPFRLPRCPRAARISPTIQRDLVAGSRAHVPISIPAKRQRKKCRRNCVRLAPLLNAH